MRDGADSLDVVVHADGRLSLSVAAREIAHDRLLLVGTLLDPDFDAPIDTTISATFDQRLTGGAHVPREGAFRVLFADQDEDVFEWSVTTHDLSEMYRIHEARVNTSVGEMRAFGIE